MPKLKLAISAFVVLASNVGAFAPAGGLTAPRTAAVVRSPMPIVMNAERRKLADMTPEEIAAERETNERLLRAKIGGFAAVALYVLVHQIDGAHVPL